MTAGARLPTVLATSAARPAQPPSQLSREVLRRAPGVRHPREPRIHQQERQEHLIRQHTQSTPATVARIHQRPRAPGLRLPRSNA